MALYAKRLAIPEKYVIIGTATIKLMCLTSTTKKVIFGLSINKSGVNESGVNESGVNEAGVNESGVNESGVKDSGVNYSALRTTVCVELQCVSNYSASRTTVHVEL